MKTLFNFLLAIFILIINNSANAETICHDAPAIDGGHTSTGKICVSNEKTFTESNIESHKDNQ